MKITKNIGNLFLWLSGADAKLIEEGSMLSRTERTKYIGLGTTVLIPAMLSFFASSYAASTFIKTPYVYIFVGLVWSLIILSIDRLLVSTLYKSVLHGNIKFYAGLMARVCIAIILGMVMSHPLTLFIFNESIYAEAEATHEAEYQALVSAYEKEQRDSLEYRLLLAEEEKLDIQYETITKERLLLTCLYELRTNEASGVVKESIYFEYIGGERVQQSCGTSTGYSGQRGRYADILEQARRVEESIAAQDAKFQQDRATFDTSMAQFNENLANQTSRIEKNTSIDYLARVNALSSLIKENEHVRSVYFILLLSLVLLDCLLVILKAVLPMGSY
ncbi:MAG: DUF4407 domain-containing protein, partial [Deferribacteraceae bacterium]|nr:DUF4407 domain-containing protein [Deferribacteraceae bacterium]